MPRDLRSKSTCFSPVPGDSESVGVRYLGKACQVILITSPYKRATAVV